MPIRNTTKRYDAPAYYHIYNRGAGNEQIFLDDLDREKFISLLARHLDRSDTKEYIQYDLEVIAYCLMGNHFHLLVFQESDHQAITGLMRSVATSYTMYFNRKYKRHGHLFQSIFKATHIVDDSHFLHMSRYIHMNPRSYLNYKWSSIAYYLGAEAPVWLNPDRVNDMGPRKYRQFLESYDGRKAELELLKDDLADQ